MQKRISITTIHYSVFLYKLLLLMNWSTLVLNRLLVTISPGPDMGLLVANSTYTLD